MCIRDRCYLQRHLACQQAYADSLIAFHTSNLATLAQAPIPVWPRAWAYEQARLGLAHVLRGNQREAIVWGTRARETAPRTVDAYTGEVYIRNLADIYVVLEEPDLAVAMLDSLLSGPHYFGVGLLRVDPWYDSLRDHSGFEALLTSYEN